MRSKLFVPGTRPELFSKAFASRADAISMDLEDAVSVEYKVEARTQVATWLEKLEHDPTLAREKIVIVRINAVDSPFFEDDLRLMVRPGVDIINLPKPSSPQEVQEVSRMIAALEKSSRRRRATGLLLNIETPRALRIATELAVADSRVMGLQLGLADLFEPHGISHSEEHAVKQAMFMISMAAAEAGIPAYDAAYANVKNPEGFRAEAELAQRLGLRGKTCIHPSQIELANAVFQPSPEEIEEARRIIAAADSVHGQGAFLVDGKMIDEPFLNRARKMLAEAQVHSSKMGSAGTSSVAEAGVKRTDKEALNEGAPGIKRSDASIVERTGMAGPLSGVRVLDLSAYIAGPYGCSLLADQGAEVIKIEPPTGDNLRFYPSTLSAESRAFLGVNRSKLGVVLNLKEPEDLSRLKALVGSADVFVHNFRPNVPSRLGIDYECLSKINPRLIYCAITGYGEVGPLKNKAGYDQVLQTMTGMCAMQVGDNGMPEILYGSVVDYYAAALVSGAVSSALYERERSGLGQYVGVSLLRSALAMQSARLIWADDEPRDVGRDMRSGGITGIHPAREGYIYVSANTPRFWTSLCEKVGLIDLLNDERYDTVRKRALHQDELVPRLRDALKARTALEWEAVFGEDVPCAAARTVEDMFDFPQVQAGGMLAEFDHPTAGRYRGFKRAVVFERTPGPDPFAAPTLNQHSKLIVAEADRLVHDG